MTIYDDVTSFDQAEDRPDQTLKWVIESDGLEGCAPMYYARVNFCNVLRYVAASAA